LILGKLTVNHSINITIVYNTKILNVILSALQRLIEHK